MRYVQIKSIPALRADNGGQAILNPGWIHARRKLTSSVLILGLKGTVAMTVGGQAIDIVPGRVVLLPVGVEHAGREELTAPASYFWLHFTVAAELVWLDDEEVETVVANQQTSSHVLQDSALIPLAFDLPEPERLKDLYREVLNQQEQDCYTTRKFVLMFQLLLITLTEIVIAARRPPREAPPTAVVPRVTEYVAEHLTDPNLSIKMVADEIGLNLDYVGRRFKQIMGISVGEYILKQRIKLALDQLKRTQDTAESIAARTGFGSLRHFLRQFKSRQGMTPKEARDAHRRMHVNSH